MAILFTGFEPFAHYSINPTENLVKTFDGVSTELGEIIGRVIKLRFGEIRAQIRNLIDEINPSAIVMTGQAARNAITPERIGINYAEASTPYNCGTKVKGTKLDTQGEDGFFSSLPIDKIVLKLRKAGIPSYISLSAGTFGCNQIFYECQRYLKLGKRQIPSGFIHVPLLPEQVVDGRFGSMTFDTMIKAFEIVFDVLINY